MMIRTIALTLILAASALGCGAPQDISGNVWNPLMAKSRVVVYDIDNVPVATAITSPFGWFRVPELTPCVIYTVRPENKLFWYDSFTFTLPGNAGVELFFYPGEPPTSKIGKVTANDDNYDSQKAVAFRHPERLHRVF